MKLPIVVDGRNLFNPSQMAAAGFLYYSVGRALQITESLPNLWHGIHFGPRPASLLPAGWLDAQRGMQKVSWRRRDFAERDCNTDIRVG